MIFIEMFLYQYLNSKAEIEDTGFRKCNIFKTQSSIIGLILVMLFFVGLAMVQLQL